MKLLAQEAASSLRRNRNSADLLYTYQWTGGLLEAQATKHSVRFKMLTTPRVSCHRLSEMC